MSRYLAKDRVGGVDVGTLLCGPDTLVRLEDSAYRLDWAPCEARAVAARIIKAADDADAASAKGLLERDLPDYVPPKLDRAKAFLAPNEVELDGQRFVKDEIGRLHRLPPSDK